MLSGPTDRRSPCFALTALLCVALQLAVFSASGWHFHGPHEQAHGFGSCGGSACAGVDGPDCCGEGACHRREQSSGHDGRDGACDQHTGEQDRRDPSKAPRDGRDPDGCGICKAIFALRHAVPAVPIALVVVRAEVHAQPLVHAQALAVAPQRRQWSRGPPMTGS